MQLSFQGEYFFENWNKHLDIFKSSIFSVFNSLMQTLEYPIVIKSDLKELDSRFLEKIKCQSRKKALSQVIEH